MPAMGCGRLGLVTPAHAGVHVPDSRFRLKRSGQASGRPRQDCSGLKWKPLGEAAKALIDALQNGLDAYLITYNTKRPHQVRGTHGGAIAGGENVKGAG